MTTTENATQTQTFSFRKWGDGWAILSDSFGYPVARGTEVTVTKRDGSTTTAIIDEMVSTERTGYLYTIRKSAPKPTEALPEVPAGFYAVQSRTGNNDLDFFSVDRPTEGRWTGYTFVRRVIGGHSDTPVRGAEAKQALAAILEAGIQESGRLYGVEIGRCYVCNRHLTDELSRELGIGPTCRGDR